MEILKRAAKRLVADVRVGEPMPTFGLAQDTVNQLKGAVDLPTLIEEVESDDAESTETLHEDVVFIEGCLRAPNGIEQTANTDKHAFTLLHWLCGILRPPLIFGWKSAFATDPQDEVPPVEVYRFTLMAVAALRAVSSLLHLTPDIFKASKIELLVCLSAFTDNSDPWTRVESRDLAADLLARYEAQSTTEISNLVPQILQSTIRPAFSKQKQSAITAGGRKAINPSLTDVSMSISPEAEEKPWKFVSPWVTTVFVWCVTQIKPTQLNELWPQVTPPTLAMLDDGAVPFKVKGCCALQSILECADGPMLKRTGLGDVFEQALLPMLSLLPTLTEEADSIALLTEAYPTLHLLAQSRFNTQADREELLKALDRIMRTGVIRGFQYAGDYPKIGALLAAETTRLVDEIGIDAVKHLKVCVYL